MSTPPSPQRRWYHLRLPRRALLEWLVLSLILTSLALYLGSQVGLGRIDRQLYDTAQSLRSRPVPSDVVIVTIDDESIAAIGRWPWRRAVLATLLDRIAKAQPRAVGVDVILSELDDRDPSGDAVLAKVMKNTPGLVLSLVAVGREGAAPELLMPAEPFVQSGAMLAHTHVEPDPDGVVRSLFLHEGLEQQQWPALSLAMGLAAEKTGGARAFPFADLPGDRRPQEAVQPGSWLRDYWVHTDFAGPPGTVKRIPAIQVLTGKVPAEQLAGKYVFIGATATGLGDAYPTPTTGNTELMPGVEVHAQNLGAMLQGRATRFASPAASAIFTLLPVALALLAFVVLSPRMVLLLVAVLIADALFLSWLILAYRQIWFPPGGAVLILLVAFPLWSWRRLEAVVHFLGQQFETMEEEPAIVPGSSATLGSRFSDVLGRKLGALRVAVERLRDARRFIADSLDSLPVATLVTGPDEQVLIANRLAAELLGAADPVQLRGQSVQALFQSLAPERPGLWPEARRLPDTAAHAEIEFQDRAQRNLLLDCAPCVDGEGRRTGFLVTLVDISVIREAQRRRDETLAFLSHDIRSPQSSILAALELHQLDPVKFPAEQIIRQIEGQARTTIQLADQFIEVSRAETQPLKLAECDLALVAHEAVDAVQAQAQAKSIRVECSAEHAVPVRGDAGLLRRALVNLINNAVKYSPANTTVTVSTALEEGKARCSVRDQGYGISEADQQRLFQRFARFSTPGQPQEKGVGLGLSFVKMVIERHHGEMRVNSTAGAGSEFGFVLPASTHRQ